MKNTTKCYSDLVKIPDFYDRIKYLQTNSHIGDQTFGGHRYLNQILYQSCEWRKIRREVIIRDRGCDLGHEDYPIRGKIYVHHINTITIEDILQRRPCVFDPENLISASNQTHNAIHYGQDIRRDEIATRRPNDTCPWR